MAWAWASMRFLDIPFLEAISRQARKLIPEFSVQNVASLSWAFAKLLVQDSQLLKA
eukprot:CAMPEP_0197641006 /NCGR_PEP_ID=MMETSP1338-20131121/15099_1 /TAXON_ID=43686 ORGANISM="Pelagodinium beii, Strain RCC1491" /NCGR_SAMPLE_ID=MMETSP1338 /ASSEMBLY_ACC=CAM_ASM_000754 /LENGTH=55 /DNA_ID=CAMNT_0043213905 /DNA_START=729 /DNA_END=893 /DNA_ORIENTATION=-